MPGASTRPLSSRRRSWRRGRATACANLVQAVQSIKKGDYRAAEQQLGRIGGDSQLGPLREYVLAWLKAGEKDFAAARARLAKLKPAAGERAEAPALVIDGADRRDGRRQGCG